jgi:transposase
VRGKIHDKLYNTRDRLRKQVFQLHGVDERGHVVVQKRVTRTKLRETVAQWLPYLIGIEACGSAQYWARELQQLGHTVKLMSPQLVKPYVKEALATYFY